MNDVWSKRLFPHRILMTGSNGYLAAHLISEILAGHPETTIICMVRCSNDDDATVKMFAALEDACAISGRRSLDASARDRISVIRGDLDDLSWVGRLGTLIDGDFEVVHCAASLSFLAADQAQVFDTNLGGTDRLLSAIAAADLPLRVFNYVSTAYVAGKTVGPVPEQAATGAVSFNNAYEQSKHLAEKLVLSTCAAGGIPFRIFRPSIIIGHSVSYRSSSMSGFYKVIDRLATFATGIAVATGGGPGAGIGLQIPREATLDLIPVDIVAAEMIAILAAGDASTGRIYHVTSDHPITLFDFAYVIGPLLGVHLQPSQGSAGRVSIDYRMLSRALSNYTSYFSSELLFDRGNIRAFGADAMQKAYRLDLSRLARFVSVYLDERRASTVEKPATGNPRRVARMAAIAAAAGGTSAGAASVAGSAVATRSAMDPQTSAPMIGV